MGFFGNSGKCEGVGGPEGGGGLTCSGCGWFGLVLCFFFCGGGGLGVVAVEVSPDVHAGSGRGRGTESRGAAAAISAAFAMNGGGVGTDGALECVVVSGAGDGNADPTVHEKSPAADAASCSSAHGARLGIPPVDEAEAPLLYSVSAMTAAATTGSSKFIIPPAVPLSLNSASFLILRSSSRCSAKMTLIRARATWASWEPAHSPIMSAPTSGYFHDWEACSFGGYVATNLS